jgi:hypothetical protein
VRHAWTFAALIACSYDPGPGSHALPDLPCAVGCVGTELETCAGDRVACEAGCAGEGAAAHCQTFVPSNLADTTDLDGVTLGLDMDGAWRIDTDTGEIQHEGTIVRLAGEGIDGGVGANFRIIDATLAVLATDDWHLRAGATLTGTGTRGLIVLVRKTAALQGVIDFANHAFIDDAGPGGGRGGRQGRAAEGCGRGGEGGGDGGFGNESGGGGGGLGSTGAVGGDGTGTSAYHGGDAGAVCGSDALVPLVGGSGGGHAGGTDGSGIGGGGGGDGGGGGGALQITALARLEIAQAAVIDAGGGGGGKTRDNDGGGGGGGSGGAVLLESLDVVIAGAVVANGGGGGTGTGGDGNRNGRPGQRSIAAAPGGDGTSGIGGAGAADAVQPIAGGPTFDGGGGGGGGVGRIRINSVTLSATGAVVSPAASTAPLVLQ